MASPLPDALHGPLAEARYGQPYPRASALNGLFWPAPARPGLYGADLGDMAVLSVAHAPALNRLGEALGSAPVTVIAFAAGGLSPAAAAAFRLVRPAAAHRALVEAGLPPGTKEGCLLVPAGLGRALGWADGQLIAGWKVHLAADEPAALARRAAALLAEPNAKWTEGAAGLPPVVERLKTGALLALGQALLFALPLAVFGLEVLAWGLGALLASMLLLSLAWPALPGPGWLRGVAAGLVLAVLLALAVSGLGLLSAAALPLKAAGVLLVSAWAGVVLSGVKE